MNDPLDKRRQFSLTKLLRLVTYCAIVAAFIHWTVSQSSLVIVMLIVYYAAVALLLAKVVRWAMSAIRGRSSKVK